MKTRPEPGLLTVLSDVKAFNLLTEDSNSSSYTRHVIPCVPAISCSIDKADSPTSVCCIIEERMDVLINFSLEKLLSPLATEPRRVKRMWRAINVMGTY